MVTTTTEDTTKDILASINEITSSALPNEIKMMRLVDITKKKTDTSLDPVLSLINTKSKQMLDESASDDDPLTKSVNKYFDKVSAGFNDPIKKYIDAPIEKAVNKVLDAMNPLADSKAVEATDAVINAVTDNSAASTAGDIGTIDETGAAVEGGEAAVGAEEAAGAEAAAEEAMAFFI